MVINNGHINAVYQSSLLANTALKLDILRIAKASRTCTQSTFSNLRIEIEG